MASDRRNGHGDRHFFRIEAVLHVIDVMAMAIKVMEIIFCDKGDNVCVRSNGDGDGTDGYCYRIETVMHGIDVMAVVMEVMDIVI